MSKKLDKVLDNVLAEAEGAPAPVDAMMDLPPRDIRDDAKFNQNKERLSPAFSHMDNLDPDEEPADKVLVQIQHHFINGEFEKAAMLLQTFRGMKQGSFFSWHHMNQLMDWVRNIYKYTNMRDLGKNYYDHEMTKDMEIAGVTDLKKVAVNDAVIDKFVKEAEKVLKRKLEMR